MGARSLAGNLHRLPFVDDYCRPAGSQPNRNGNPHPIGPGPMPIRIANRPALSQLRDDNQFRLVCPRKFSRCRLRSADGSLACPSDNCDILGWPLCRDYRTIGLSVDRLGPQPILCSPVYGAGNCRLGVEDFHSSSWHRRMARLIVSLGITPRSRKICLVIGPFASESSLGR